MSNKEIAECLNRSVPSVKYQLRSLKINRVKDFNLFEEIKGERWSKIDDTYSVSDKGRVKNDLTRVVRKTSLDRYGYERVTLKNNTSYAIHVLVAKHFIENPKKLPEVNHNDGVKAHNVFTNLEWCTEEYNLRHALEIGLRNTLGENSPRSKMTEKEAISACEMLNSGKTSAVIVATINNPEVSKNMIDKIRSGQRWKHLSKNYSFLK